MNLVDKLYKAYFVIKVALCEAKASLPKPYKLQSHASKSFANFKARFQNPINFKAALLKVLQTLKPASKTL